MVDPLHYIVTVPQNMESPPSFVAKERSQPQRRAMVGTERVF